MVEIDNCTYRLDSVKALGDLHDHLYDAADRLFKKYNPCGIENGACIANRGKIWFKKGCCCRGCKYLSLEGCTTRSLACKLWFCGAVEILDSAKTKDEFLTALKRLTFVSNIVGLSRGVRTTKEEELAVAAKYIGIIK
jgi:hypothetical protein